jgi:hypothetical protein
VNLPRSNSTVTESSAVTCVSPEPKILVSATVRAAAATEVEGGEVEVTAVSLRART